MSNLQRYAPQLLDGYYLYRWVWNHNVRLSIKLMILLNMFHCYFFSFGGCFWIYILLEKQSHSTQMCIWNKVIQQVIMIDMKIYSNWNLKNMKNEQKIRLFFKKKNSNVFLNKKSAFFKHKFGVLFKQKLKRFFFQTILLFFCQYFISNSSMVISW